MSTNQRVLLMKTFLHHPGFVNKIFTQQIAVSIPGFIFVRLSIFLICFITA